LFRSEGDPKPCCDQREHALLAAGVGLELDAAAHERGVEFAGRVTVVPALNEEGLPPQALPIDRVMLREWMCAWDRRNNPFAVERRAHGVGPQCVARHQSNIDPTLPHGPLDLPLVHFRDRKHDLRMSFSPFGQEAPQRFTDRRHSHREADFADDAIAILIADMTNGVELGQRAADVQQYRLAARRQPNASVPTFKHCETELVLESSHATADRRCVDSEGLGCMREVACGRRRLEIHEITNLHVRQALQVYSAPPMQESAAGVWRSAGRRTERTKSLQRWRPPAPASAGCRSRTYATAFFAASRG